MLSQARCAGGVIPASTTVFVRESRTAASFSQEDLPATVSRAQKRSTLQRHPEGEAKPVSEHHRRVTGARAVNGVANQS
jgi:hypothetical protein